MCGIAGYIGTNVEKTLIDNLKMLEYRGYDSAGIATLNNNLIKVVKSSGKIANLEKKLVYKQDYTCGIAHTRWATHGKPNKTNAHPHSSNNNTWAIVHNGIIENYNQIKTELESMGFKFKSQTDTEVVCNLLQFNKDTSPIKTLIKTAKMLNGSFALACLNKNYKNTLFLAKNKSPIFVAKNKECVYVSSDIVCFKNKVDEFYELNDNEFCEVTSNKIVFYNINGKIIKKNTKKLSNLDNYYTKDNFNHFMIKEIFETPVVLKNLVINYKKNNYFKLFNKNYISKFNKVVLIGCGSAYHAAQIGAKFLQENARIDASAHIASEYRYSNPLINKKTLCILVSQSGETADTLGVCSIANKNKATTIALTNVPYSSLARNCKSVLPVCAGTEIAVASTKAYTAQISVLYMLSMHLKNELWGENNNYFDDISQISNNLNLSFEEFFDLTKSIKNAKNVFFIGRSYDYITAQEASLKLKEITYIFSSEHASGELKHGFLALIDKSSYLFAIATQKNLLDKTLNGAFESQARGAKVIFVTQFDLPPEISNKFYKVIKLQTFKEELMPISSIVPFQQFAYFTSINKGINPDQPRNLAKSVTVE